MVPGQGSGFRAISEMIESAKLSVFQGKKEGFGAYHFQDGQVREGYWHNGRLFQSTTVPACTVKSTEEEDEAHSQEEEDEAVLIEEGRYFPNPGEEEHPVFVADHSKVLHAIQVRLS